MQCIGRRGHASCVAYRSTGFKFGEQWQGERLAENTRASPKKTKNAQKATVSHLETMHRFCFLMEGAAAALANVFGLRVPSELLKQAHAFLLKDLGTRIKYGPIRRKGKRELCVLRRFCTCKSNALLCPHPWIALLRERVPQGSCFSFSADVLMRRLRPFLPESGVPREELHQWTSHCFRRGGGVDILEQHG